MIPLHLGAMHPFEQALVIALAVGPFLVLGVVIVIRKRAEDPAEADEPEPTEPDPNGEPGAGPAGQRDR